MAKHVTTFTSAGARYPVLRETEDSVFVSIDGQEQEVSRDDICATYADPDAKVELKPDKYQQAVIDQVQSGRGHIIVAAVAGSGKCLGKGTPVLMYDGRIVPVESVVKDDLLMGPDSQPRRVLKTNIGHGPLFKIIPHKGDPWVCNGDHILTLAGTNRFKGTKIDISLNDYKQRCRELSSYKMSWKLFSTGVDFAPPNKPLPIDPYFLGLWIGDGTKEVISGRGLVTVVITKPDLEVFECCKEIADKWGLEVSRFAGISYRISNPRKKGKFGSGSNSLLNALRSVVGETITIPREYLTASRADREALLAGWLDSDGHCANGYYEIAQKRVDHADAVEFLARSLGFRTTRTIKTVKGLPYQRIAILGDASKLPLRIPRKKAKSRQQIKDVTVTGFSTESIGAGDYFGFTLDGDGRFLLGDFTVTHNSSTLKMVAEATGIRGKAVCFNKQAALELVPKMRGTNMEACTIHSLGFSVLKRNIRTIKVDDDKYGTMLKAIIKSRSLAKQAYAGDVKRVFDWMRLNMLPPTQDSWEQLIVEHSFEATTSKEIGAELCKEIWELGKNDMHHIDFTDMVWLPVERKLSGERYPWLLIDEYQDISRLSYQFLKRCLLPGGRMLFVGDRRQSIYHFAGADAGSCDNILQDTQAAELPLSICYRCAQNIVKEAKQLCEQIEPAETAEMGVVRRIDYDDLHDTVQEGDMILCRLTAPLITLCYALIMQGISALVRGRDIGKGLVNTIVAVSGGNRHMSIQEFGEALNAHFLDERIKASHIQRESVREMRRQILQDKEDCLYAVIEGSLAKTVDALIDSVESIFSDDRPSIVLSTIHRAKGLENPRVFYLQLDWKPKTTNPVQLEQEVNLRYVAITRAKKELVYVDKLPNTPTQKPRLKAQV